MSSWRDQMVFTGRPISLAILTACGMKSCTMPRRPKPPPSIILWTTTLRGGTPAAVAPGDRQGVERFLGLPPGIGHHRHGVVESDDPAHARPAGDRGLVDALQFAAEHRALGKRRA